MIFYLIILSVAILFFRICSKASYKDTLFWISYIPFILLLSIIEGCRDLNVGTDLQVYGERYFYDACFSSNFFKYILSCNGEWGYHVFMWICSRISPSINIMLFLLALVKILLVSYTALRLRKYLNPVLFMLAYLCFSYITGYNIMRQVFAMSFVIFGFPFLLEKKYIIYAVISILSMTIHSSAFIAFLILGLYFLANFKLSIWFTIASIVIVYVFSFSIMNYLQSADIGLYSTKASLYMEREGVTTSKANILIIIMYIIYAYKFKSALTINRHFRFFFSLVIFNLFFILMSSTFEVAVRLSWYILHLINILFLISVKYTNRRKFLCLSFSILYVIYFIFDAIHGLGGCLPYKSAILNI